MGPRVSQSEFYFYSSHAIHFLDWISTVVQQSRSFKHHPCTTPLLVLPFYYRYPSINTTHLFAIPFCLQYPFLSISTTLLLALPIFYHCPSISTTLFRAKSIELTMSVTSEMNLIVQSLPLLPMLSHMTWQWLRSMQRSGRLDGSLPIR